MKQAIFRAHFLAPSHSWVGSAIPKEGCLVTAGGPNSRTASRLMGKTTINLLPRCVQTCNNGFQHHPAPATSMLVHRRRTLRSSLLVGADAAGTYARFVLDGDGLRRAIHILSAGAAGSDGRTRIQTTRATPTAGYKDCPLLFANHFC